MMPAVIRAIFVGQESELAYGNQSGVHEGSMLTTSVFPILALKFWLALVSKLRTFSQTKRNRNRKCFLQICWQPLMPSNEKNQVAGKQHTFFCTLGLEILYVGTCRCGLNQELGRSQSIFLLLFLLICLLLVGGYTSGPYPLLSPSRFQPKHTV